MSAEYLVRIMEARMEKEGISQKDLAKLTGIRPSTISRWTNRYNDPNIGTFIVAADILGMRLALIDNLTGEEMGREKININNMPKTYRRYVVARSFDGELWYWGSWDEFNDASNAANSIGGKVFDSTEIM